MQHLFGAVGRKTLKAVDSLRGLLGLLSDTLYWAVVSPFKGQRIRWRSTVEQMRIMGFDSLPIVILIAVFIGIIMAVQSGYYLSKLGASTLIADSVAISLMRELGPLMTAIIVTGRSGSAIAAELGTMAVSEEIDALRVMGLNPVHFLVVPRFLAMVVMLPCLTAFAIMTGLLGGMVVTVAAFEVGTTAYLAHTRDALELRDILICLLKSAVFGAIIAKIGSYQGLRVSGGAAAVGHSTTAAVVASIVLIIAADVVFASLFYSGGASR